MSITLQEARNAILSGGFFEKSSTVKLSEFESKTTGRTSTCTSSKVSQAMRMSLFIRKGMLLRCWPFPT
jgi:hypothetical protein